MNIIVKTSSGKIAVRPDTTWEKDNEDFYPPEFVDELTYSPVLFARILKPGRSVGRKFASRYYDSIGFGVLLYPENMLDGTPEGYAQAICLDHTSFLPSPMFPPLRLGSDSEIHLFLNGKEIFATAGICHSEDADPTNVSKTVATTPSSNLISLNMIEGAIVEATKLLYIRTGDLIAIELSARTPLVCRQDSNARITGTFGQDKVLDFQIIF